MSRREPRFRHGRGRWGARGNIGTSEQAWEAAKGRMRVWRGWWRGGAKTSILLTESQPASAVQNDPGMHRLHAKAPTACPWHDEKWDVARSSVLRERIPRDQETLDQGLPCADVDMHSTKGGFTIPCRTLIHTYQNEGAMDKRSFGPKRQPTPAGPIYSSIP